jgi:1-acyl-sn-glycerol-3-phosphate acyltransferase
MKTKAIEQRVLEILRELIRESGQERALRALDLHAALDRDLGLDSLTRIELMHRVETSFHVRLTDQVMATAQTPLDLVDALMKGDVGETRTSVRQRSEREGGSGPPSAARSLVDALLHHAENEPDRTHIHLFQSDQEEKRITYGGLLNDALSVARGLRERGISHGDTVSLMLPTSEAFFQGFFGILLAGGIPVPIYPPFRPDRLEEYSRRQAGILRNAGVKGMLTFRRAEALAKILQTEVPGLSWVTGVDEMRKPGPREIPSVRGEDVALIQYTSGSTGDPRGVVLTHDNLLSNLRAMGEAVGVRPMDAGVSWLPLYHDMGLIGAWLGSLYFGIPVTILPPEAFLMRPERWLWAIHYHRASFSAAPNFAYELCVRKIDNAMIEGLDLSSWRMALSGAEPVNPETLDRFAQRFAPYGFRRESLLPVYGLAESSLGVAFPPVGRGPWIDRVTRSTKGDSRKMEEADPEEATPLRFVSCGRPLPGHEVRIVDETGGVLRERMEGHLQFRGPSTMQGYYRNEAATQAVVRGEWVDSGDLAYWVDGELFITGRAKDTIIKAGRNLYPQEVEEIAGEVPGVRKGCVAAFGFLDEETGTERLILAAETRETRAAARERIAAAIVERVTEGLGTPPDGVCLAPPGTIPKTSSGKIRRSDTRELYLQGRLTGTSPSVRSQWIRLTGRGVSSRVGSSLRRFRLWLSGAYVWGVFILFLGPAYLSLLLTRDRFAAKAVERRWAGRTLRAAGYRIDIVRLDESPDNTGTGGPCLWVSNHASYLDALVLIASLPGDFVFVAKQELLRAPAIGTFIRRVGHLTVNRRDPARGRSEVEPMKETLRQGISVLVFPEGTTTRATGLRPFTLGAFRVAVEMDLPIRPVALRGTREILRPDSWWPRPGKVTLTVGSPLIPEGDGWTEIIRLRDAAKAEIAAHCGERPLDLVLAGLPPEG